MGRFDSFEEDMNGTKHANKGEESVDWAQWAARAREFYSPDSALSLSELGLRVTAWRCLFPPLGWAHVVFVFRNPFLLVFLVKTKFMGSSEAVRVAVLSRKE